MGNKQDKERQQQQQDNDSNGRTERRDSGEQPKTSYWQIITHGYSELVHAIIRPPRSSYEISMLGPQRFRVNGEVWIRKDIQLCNQRGLKIECSHWMPENIVKPMPVVVYLHGNASCRLEALECLPLVASAGLQLFALDFSGSGKSEGEYISLGWFEREDVSTVVEYLRGVDNVSSIGLWGRSMGAVTALMFADRDPTIACMILDSPFASLRQLAKELVDHAQVAVPKFAVGIALKFVRGSVKSRAGFDINKLEPIKFAKSSYVPALFGAAEDDMFIPPHHSKQIFDEYSGDKNLINFEGDHNSPRPQFFNASVGIFLYNTMVVPCGADPSPRDASASADIEDFGERENYAFPAPMAPSGAGLGIRIGTQSHNGVSVVHTQGVELYSADRGDDDDDDDVYEQAMIRHALELSLAEAMTDNQKNDETKHESNNKPKVESENNEITIEENTNDEELTCESRDTSENENAHEKYV